jgi:hypothetical protein
MLGLKNMTYFQSFIFLLWKMRVNFYESIPSRLLLCILCVMFGIEQKNRTEKITWREWIPNLHLNCLLLTTIDLLQDMAECWEFGEQISFSFFGNPTDIFTWESPHTNSVLTILSRISSAVIEDSTQCNDDSLSFHARCSNQSSEIIMLVLYLFSVSFGAMSDITHKTSLSRDEVLLWTMLNDSEIMKVGGLHQHHAHSQLSKNITRTWKPTDLHPTEQKLLRADAFQSCVESLLLFCEHPHPSVANSAALCLHDVIVLTSFTNWSTMFYPTASHIFHLLPFVPAKAQLFFLSAMSHVSPYILNEARVLTPHRFQILFSDAQPHFSPLSISIPTTHLVANTSAIRYLQYVILSLNLPLFIRNMAALIFGSLIQCPMLIRSVTPLVNLPFLLQLIDLDMAIWLPVPVSKEDVHFESPMQQGKGYVIYTGTFTNQRVLVKVFDPVATPLSNTTFQIEMSVLSSFSHPSIVTAYGIGLRHMFIVTPYFDLTLFDRLYKNNSKFLDVNCLLCKIADAMKYLHEAMFIHSHLTPRCIFMDNYDDPHIVLFDVTTCQDLDEELYCAPMGYEGEEVDLFAFGVLMWELIHAQRPHTASNWSSMKEVREKVDNGYRLPTGGLGWQQVKIIEYCWGKNEIEFEVGVGFEAICLFMTQMGIGCVSGTL